MAYGSTSWTMTCTGCAVRDSTLRRPLIAAGITVIAALVVLLSAYTFLARGTFTSTRLTQTLASGWVGIGVRAPESQGGVVTMLPVGGPAVSTQTVRSAAASDALSINDPNGLSQALADATRRPMAGAVVLDRLAFAGLVDVVGGIEITVDVPFTVTRTDGSTTHVPAGTARLDGIAASAYVLADPKGSHLNTALQALLQALPQDHDQLLGIVKSLGMSMRATVSAATVVQWLEFWHSRL